MHGLTALSALFSWGSGTVACILLSARLNIAKDLERRAEGQVQEKLVVSFLDKMPKLWSAGLRPLFSLSPAKKAHKPSTHKLLLLPFDPGLCQGQTGVCPWDKLGLHCAKQGQHLGQTGSVPGTNPGCAWDKSGVVPRPSRAESEYVCVPPHSFDFGRAGGTTRVSTAFRVQACRLRC